MGRLIIEGFQVLLRASPPSGCSRGRCRGGRGAVNLRPLIGGPCWLSSSSPSWRSRTWRTISSSCGGSNDDDGVAQLLGDEVAGDGIGTGVP